MTVLLTAARVLLVSVSLVGYVHTVSKRLRPELAVGFVFACIGSVMFLAGLAGILPIAAWALCAGGAALAVRALVRRDSFRYLLCPGLIFLLGYGVLLTAAVYGCRFAHADDFNHWAVAVQKLLRYDRFPIASDYYYYYPSYPLGSTSFVYYFAYLTGLHAEWVQVYIQDMLIAGMLTGLFVFARRWHTAMLAAAVCVLLPWADTAYDHQLFYSLLVDILLPATALSAMALCLLCREQLAEKLWWTAPYTVFLMSVKNSGAFFAALVLVCALVFMKKRRRSLLRWLGCALCPTAALLLWQQHVRIAFPEGGLAAKHSMSLQNFQQVFAGKTADDVSSIARMYCGRILSFSNPMLYILAALAVLYIVQRSVLRGSRRDVLRIGALICLSYVGYMAGMMGMYLFTMPLEEAEYLAGFDRYEMTVTIFSAGLLFMGAGPLLDRLGTPPALAGPALCGALLVLLLLPLRPNPQYLRGQDLQGHHRDYVESVLDGYSFPLDKRFLVITASGEYLTAYCDDLSYLVQPSFYVFQPVDFMAGKDFLLSSYDYLIALESSDAVRAYMQSHFGDPDLHIVALAS